MDTFLPHSSPRAQDTQSVCDATQKRQHSTELSSCRLPLVDTTCDKWHPEPPFDHVLAERAGGPDRDNAGVWHSQTLHPDASHHFPDLLLSGDCVGGAVVQSGFCVWKCVCVCVCVCESVSVIWGGGAWHYRCLTKHFILTPFTSFYTYNIHGSVLGVDLLLLQYKGREGVSSPVLWIGVYLFTVFLSTSFYPLLFNGVDWLETL